MRVSVAGNGKKRFLQSKQAICGATAVECRHRWLANLTVHPHAKRCTYLRNGALHARARLRSRACVTTPAQSLIRRGVSVRLYLPEVFLSFSRISPLLCCRYSPVRTYYSFCGLHHHPQRWFLSLSNFQFPFSSIAYRLGGTCTEQ